MPPVRDHFVDLDTPQGPMRTYVYEPKTENVYAEKKYPGLIFYTAIFQRTPAIDRIAKRLAGHGYVVMVPEIYHALCPPGTIFEPTDPKQLEEGNRLKKIYKLDVWDNDVKVLVAALKSHPLCSGRVGCLGHCIGGHLVIRAAFNPDIIAAASFFPTDLHNRTLGEGENADTINRFSDVKGELMVFWGRQDPHIPDAGRLKIYQALQSSTCRFSWFEFNANHSYLTDNDPKGRYEPAVSDLCFDIMFDLFSRTL